MGSEMLRAGARNEWSGRAMSLTQAGKTLELVSTQDPTFPISSNPRGMRDGLVRRCRAREGIKT